MSEEVKQSGHVRIVGAIAGIGSGQLGYYNIRNLHSY